MSKEYISNLSKVTPELGDKIHLATQVQEVIACQETGAKMLNIDADQLAPGDLTLIKKLGLTISNPNTEKPVALGVDYVEKSFGHKLADWFSSPTGSDDDDSSFFSSSSSSSSSGIFGGSSGFGGFSSGGFGGFGGGSFSGGGASAHF